MTTPTTTPPNRSMSADAAYAAETVRRLRLLTEARARLAGASNHHGVLDLTQTIHSVVDALTPEQLRTALLLAVAAQPLAVATQPVPVPPKAGVS